MDCFKTEMETADLLTTPETDLILSFCVFQMFTERWNYEIIFRFGIDYLNKRNNFLCIVFLVP